MSHFSRYTDTRSDICDESEVLRTREGVTPIQSSRDAGSRHSFAAIGRQMSSSSLDTHRLNDRVEALESASSEAAAERSELRRRADWRFDNIQLRLDQLEQNNRSWGQTLVTKRHSPTRTANRVNNSTSGGRSRPVATNLRYIVIDGQNVGYKYGGDRFSWKGVDIAVQFFKNRNHKDVMVVVPHWLYSKHASSDIVRQLQRSNTLCTAPDSTDRASDDKYMLSLASRKNGVILSNNMYGEFRHTQSWSQTIRHSILKFSFAGEIFLPDPDPLQRGSDTLDIFLQHGSTDDTDLRTTTIGPRSGYGDAASHTPHGYHGEDAYLPRSRRPSTSSVSSAASSRPRIRHNSAQSGYGYQDEYGYRPLGRRPSTSSVSSTASSRPRSRRSSIQSGYGFTQRPESCDTISDWRKKDN